MSELTTDCPRCHMRVTMKDRRVVSLASLYHLECYNAWHFAAFGRYPRLRARLAGDRRQYEPLGEDAGATLSPRSSPRTARAI